MRLVICTVPSGLCRTLPNAAQLPTATSTALCHIRRDIQMGYGPTLCSFLTPSCKSSFTCVRTLRDVTFYQFQSQLRYELTLLFQNWVKSRMPRCVSILSKVLLHDDFFQFCFRMSSRPCGEQIYQKLSLTLSLLDKYASQSSLTDPSKSQGLKPTENVLRQTCRAVQCALHYPYLSLCDEIQFIHSLICCRRFVVVSLLGSLHPLFTFCDHCGWSELGI